MLFCLSGRKKPGRLLKANREKHKEYVQTLEKRIAVLEYQNKALREQIKKLMQLYEQDLSNATLIKLILSKQ